MALRVGTIIEWFSPAYSAELCENGHCIGKVTEVITSGEFATKDNPLFVVKWWEMCASHAEADPNGTGPYDYTYLWEIGQLNHS